MSLRKRPSLAGWRAVIVHRPHSAVDALRRQLEALSISVRTVWPELGDADADVVFFDADMGTNGMFPWPAGYAPMPLIALIGSEAPGRVEWGALAGLERASAEADRVDRRLFGAADRHPCL